MQQIEISTAVNCRTDVTNQSSIIQNCSRHYGEIMQRATILVLSLFATVTIGINDDFAERLSQTLSLTKTDVQLCMNKTNVQLEDLEKLDEMIINNIHTSEIEESVTKVGCLFACLSQKKEIMSGARFNINKLKELSDAKIGRPLTPEMLALRNRILDTCNERGINIDT